MTAAATTTVIDLPLDRWHAEVSARVGSGDRFAGVYASHSGDTVLLHALVVGGRWSAACGRGWSPGPVRCRTGH